MLMSPLRIAGIVSSAITFALALALYLVDDEAREPAAHEETAEV